MRRYALLTYGSLAYGLFLLTFLYAVGFVSGVAVPKAIDDGREGFLPAALLLNLGLLGLFGVQHSVMARPWFKAWWTRFVPVAAERSTFVMVTNAIFALLFLLWRPIPDVVWHVEAPALRALLWTLAAAGWILALIATFAIDHFDLFGLKQTWRAFRGLPYEPPRFHLNPLYRTVRHPLQLGFLIAFWSAPTMTAGHLLFSATCTAYILFALRLEERDLVRAHPAYATYRREVPMLLPRPWRSAARFAAQERTTGAA